MDEKDSIMLYDEILNNNDWLYLKPRSDTAKYFKDIKSLISILKKENINREDFEIEIQKEIERLQNDPASISSRGESKGELKKDILKKIEGLYRTLEVGRFYALYEQNKKVKNLFYTGQLTVPGPGVPPCIISGKLVAEQVLKYLNKN